MSGDAPSLSVSPTQGLSLEEKQCLSHSLLRPRMPIKVMNEIDRCVSAARDGKLAKVAAPARGFTYLISEVPGEVVGSGPTVSSSIELQRTLELPGQYEAAVSPSILATMTNAEITATRSNVPAAVHVLVTPLMALQAATNEMRRQGIQSVVLSDALESEAREVGKVLGGITRSIAVPIGPPCILISRDETRVTTRGEGRGGRNAELLLSLLGSVTGLETWISAIACDTDGIDDMEDDTGILFNEETTLKATASSSLTHTNFNDLRAILVR